MSAQERRAQLRAILGGERCAIASSLFDPMSARIADALGFEVGLIGGSVASLAVLGAPDLALITLTELAEQARRVCRAGRLSVVVDADHGYGNALNVMRTVEELESAGVAGATIEDTALPLSFAGETAAAPPLIPLEEGVGKMKAALKARSAGMAVLGRTHAVMFAGVDDAIQRLQAYERAGVDALFVPYLKNRGQLDAIAQAVRLPLVLAGCDDSLADTDYLASRRVRIWMSSHQPFAAAVGAMYEAQRAMREALVPEPLPGSASAALMASLTRSADYDSMKRDYGLQ